MAIDFDFKDPKNQKLIAAFMIIVVALFASFNFVIKPVRANLRTKKAEAAEIQKKIDSILNILQEPQKIEQMKLMYQARVEELDAILPVKEEIPELLDQISLIEKETRVHLMGFNALDTIDDGARPYISHRYSIKLEAGYHQFGNFMSRLTTLQRLLSISDLIITVNQLAGTQEKYEGLEEMPRNLTVEFVLTSYVFRNLQAGQK
jgi:Tfp pilus assembly protein PilO